MENLTIAETKYTPEISMDQSGVITITGKSYPENTFEFYQPVLDWLTLFFKEKPSDSLTVNLELLYFNSSSSKLFFDFFDILSDNNDDCTIVIHWIYDEENESAEEAGEDFVEDFEDLTIHLTVKDA